MLSIFECILTSLNEEEQTPCHEKIHNSYRSWYRVFARMTTAPISIVELTDTRSKMVTAIREGLTANEKAFLLAIKRASPTGPNLELMGLRGCQEFSGN